ncbi:E3 ubiquitin-protein ligase MARCHF5-like [Drosophila tropicalis]|uniref:E3 ubiquitin-protein ligase MARCHF5-like n=1 Tax=Drosophila tropicalis TaxID=46794 RepID=UPI0035AB9E28
MADRDTDDSGRWYEWVGDTPVDTERETGMLCWICFANEAENPSARWVHPCQCRGTGKWVHQSCLYRWIDEKQKVNPYRAVVCQQCQSKYLIVYPKMNPLADRLDQFDHLVRYYSRYVATGFFLGCIYWIAITYGALTVVQVLGQERGVELMEKGNPFFLLIGLPVIPVGLILLRLIRWENVVLRFIQGPHKILRKLPLSSWFTHEAETELNGAGDGDGNGDGDGDDSNQIVVLPTPSPAIVEPFNVSRALCGAIALPTLATFVGKLVYQSVGNPLHRALLGGVTYIAVKGILKIYLRQKQHIRRRHRRILNYTDENIRLYGHGVQNEAVNTERQDAAIEDWH